LNEAVNRGVSLDRVLDRVVGGVAKIFGYLECDIFLLDTDSTLMLAAISIAPEQKKAIEKLIGKKIVGHKTPLFEGSHLKKVLDTKKPHTTNDLIGFLHSFSADDGLKKFVPAVAKILSFKSALCVPLLSNGVVLGVLGAGKRDKISKEDLEALELFASHIALIVDQKKSEDSLLRAQRDLEKLLNHRKAKLDESEKLYQSLIETSPDAITVTDLVGNLIMVNKQAAALHGFNSVREMVKSGKTAFDFIASEDMQRAIENIKKTLEMGSIRNAEYLLLKRDGTTLPAELSASIFTDQKGQPKGFIGVIRDVTKRKRAEDALKTAYDEMESRVEQRTADLLASNEKLKDVIKECNLAQDALKKSEELFRIVTEGALAGVYIVQDGKFKYVNPALARTFGYAVEDLLERLGPLELTHPDDHALVSEQIRRRLSGERETIRYTFRGHKKDNNVIYCEVLARRHEYRGNPAIIGNLIDITDQKLAEDEMKRRLMKYSLREGLMYFIKEQTPNMSLEAFKDLLNVGYHGCVISRTPEIEFKKNVEGEYDFHWLSEKGKTTLRPKVDVLEQMLETLHTKHAILVERLDYLIFKNGFKKTLTFIQRLRDLGHISGHVVILSFDPNTVSKRELRLLDKEGYQLETLKKEGLPESLLEVLRFVNRQNMLGIKPSYTDVGKNLAISKPTVQKRIKLLTSGGYIGEAVSGRRKSIEISERGKDIFNR
jgi:PAS domain S-box-containing protein